MILRMIDLRSSSSSPDRSPLTRKPAPTGFATGNSAMKADMNVKRNPSFNILGFGTLYCGAKIINNYSKPPVCPHNMFRGANSRAAFSLLPVFPAAGGSALSLSPGRREAACSGYGTFFGLLFLRPCPLAFAPCPGSGDAPLQGFESGCGRGGGAPHAPGRRGRAVSHAGSSPPSRIRRDAVLSA